MVGTSLAPTTIECVERGSTMTSMTRMTREQQQRHNRVLLLEAAERAFAEKGVQGTSLDDVAKEAGLTKGAVYSNFRGKGELILEVIRHRQSHTPEAARFQRALAAPTESERFEAWCDAWVRTARSDERSRYARLLFDFVPYALRDEDLTRRFREFITPDESAPEASPIPSGGDFARLPVSDQARILLALDLGLSMLRLFDPDHVSAELYRTALGALAGLPGDQDPQA